MTVTIKIDDLPVEVQITHYLPPEPPRGLYGHSSAAEVALEWPGWLESIEEKKNECANHAAPLAVENLLDAT